MPDAPYVTAAQIRAAVTGLTDETKYPNATLERFVARFEQVAENYRGVAFTPRTETETITAGSGRLLLSRPRVISVESITYNTGTAPEVEDVEIVDGFALARSPWGTGWPCGTRITVEYVHGYATPPPSVIDACIEFVRAEAIQQKGSQPRNVTGERTDLGWIPEATANWAEGRPTRWVVVNEALNQLPDERIPGIA